MSGTEILDFTINTFRYYLQMPKNSRFNYKLSRYYQNQIELWFPIYLSFHYLFHGVKPQWFLFKALIIQNLKSQSFQVKKSKISLVIFNLKYQHFRFSFQVFLGILEKKSIKCQKNLKRKSKMLIFQIVDDKKHILEK